jgi:hypothetical protein
MGDSRGLLREAARRFILLYNKALNILENLLTLGPFIQGNLP